MAKQKLSAEAKLLQEMARLAQSLGLEQPAEFAEIEEARREADSLALYIENPSQFRETRCKECRSLFATNYSAVAFCSDNCRIRSLDRIGIVWNPTKSQNERWAGKIPLVCGSDALALAKLALAQGPVNL